MKAACAGPFACLKNIAGMWLLQSCRRSWPAGFLRRPVGCSEAPASVHFADRSRRSGLPESAGYAGGDRRLLRRAPVNPRPPRRRRTRGRFLKAWRSNIGDVLESLEEITARRFREIRVIGGGSRNRVLNQFTADATGRTVIAGPVEATALGNIAMQMLATGAVTTLSQARAIIAQSFPTETIRARLDRRRGRCNRAVSPPARRMIMNCYAVSLLRSGRRGERPDA